jgi:hypothetical protein
MQNVSDDELKDLILNSKLEELNMLSVWALQNLKGAELSAVAFYVTQRVKELT